MVVFLTGSGLSGGGEQVMYDFLQLQESREESEISSEEDPQTLFRTRKIKTRHETKSGFLASRYIFYFNPFLHILFQDEFIIY